MVHMQQRQPRDRPDRGARPRDVEQSGRHAQVGIGLLKFPGKLAQPHAAHLRAGEDGHRVGVEPLHHFGHAAQAGNSRNPRDFGAARWVWWPGHAGCDDRQAVISPPAQLGGELGGHGRVPGNHHDPPQAPAAAAELVQPLTERVPGA